MVGSSKKAVVQQKIGGKTRASVTERKAGGPSNKAEEEQLPNLPNVDDDPEVKETTERLRIQKEKLEQLKKENDEMEGRNLLISVELGEKGYGDLNLSEATRLGSYAQGMMDKIRAKMMEKSQSDGGGSSGGDMPEDVDNKKP